MTMVQNTLYIADKGFVPIVLELCDPDVFGRVCPVPLPEVNLVNVQGCSTDDASHFCEAVIMILH